MFRIGIESHFSAAHQLADHRGKCSRLHGHSWRVEAVFEAAELGAGGLLVDFEEARVILEECIDRFDHSFLNELEEFDTVSPTAENVARVLYEGINRQVQEKSWPVRLGSVKVWESPDAWASYDGK